MFKHRGLVGIICLFPVGIIIIFSSPLVEEGTFIDFAMDALGWFCFAFYVTFRIWATLYIGGRKDKELQTHGPYSITRNPLYFGTFCFMFSITLFLKSASLLAMMLITTIIYSRWVIAAEEQVLEGIFGNTFRDYVHKTPRLLPRFSYYHVPDSVEVKLKAMKTEARRLWCAALMPFLAEVIMHLRSAPWWPHWFTLP